MSRKLNKVFATVETPGGKTQKQIIVEESPYKKVTSKESVNMKESKI